MFPQDRLLGSDCCKQRLHSLQPHFWCVKVPFNGN
jgi:hypothetical protein